MNDLVKQNVLSTKIAALCPNIDGYLAKMYLG